MGKDFKIRHTGIMLGSLSGFERIFYRLGCLYEFDEDFCNHSIRIRRGSKGFLCGFYMDFHVDSLGNPWKSRASEGILHEFLQGGYGNFGKDSIGFQ